MANQPTSQDKIRVQLDLSPKEILRLNWVMEICDLSTRKELFNNALQILEWAARETNEGRRVASFDETSKDRFILSMPALSAAEIHGLQARAVAPVAKGRKPTVKTQEPAY